ncbi:hypothetical protein, partial [Cryptosporidium parvum Iowa II]
DFSGQDLAYKIQERLVILTGIMSFIIGFYHQKFYYTVLTTLLGLAITLLRFVFLPGQCIAETKLTGSLLKIERKKRKSVKLISKSERSGRKLKQKILLLLCSIQIHTSLKA